MTSISLSRTTSRETDSIDSDLPLSLPTSSNPPSPNPTKPDSSQASLPAAAAGAGAWMPRTPSHSLLSSAPNPSVTSRKSRFADAGTTGTVGRASISMPPPITKPSSTYMPSAVRRPSTLLATGNRSGVESTMDGAADTKNVNESAVMEDQEQTPGIGGSQSNATLEPGTSSTLPSSSLRPVNPPGSSPEVEGNRLSFSSLYSLGSAIYNGATGGSDEPSAASSNAGSIRSGCLDPTVAPTLPNSPPLGSAKAEASLATTATNPISVTANARSPNAVPLKDTKETASVPLYATTKNPDSFRPDALPRPPPGTGRSRSRTQRNSSNSNVASSTGSPHNSDRIKPPPIGTIGVCALDAKARSKASQKILTRLQSNGDFNVIVFGDKVILDEGKSPPLIDMPILIVLEYSGRELANMNPMMLYLEISFVRRAFTQLTDACSDFLISFFSDGFPLEKAIAYEKLRKPFSINDLSMQRILWDRRICLRILDCMDVPTPKRIEVNRDGGPVLESTSLADHVFKLSGVKLEGALDGTGGGMPATKSVSMTEENDTLLVDGVALRKPFVEKPVSGEDHNINIYFPKNHEGGGGRKLFRKIGNKSSEWDPNLIVPRAITEEGSSYIYEQFLHVDNAEDIKAYTVGPNFCHAETRKSPVVDGLVRRNTHGKEIRYITSLTSEESVMATKIANGFGQRICGFDLLRSGPKSFVIDVNGWSFVKDNNEYYDNCARILKQLFLKEKQKVDGVTSVDETAETQPEPVPNRKSNTGSYRSAIKSMVKSPSISQLASHHLKHHSHGTISPKLSATTASLSSPPSFERRPASTVPVLPSDDKAQLPSPALPLAVPKDPNQKSSSVPDVPTVPIPQPASKHAWKLKGMVSVIRHADRTPKQKFKFTFHTQPFIDLLQGHQEEVLLKGEASLNSVLNAVKVAMEQREEDPDKLQTLRNALARKGAWTGTKVQIKPMFRKRKRQEMEKNGDEDIAENSVQHVPIAAAEFTVDPEEHQDESSKLEDGGELSRIHTRNDSSAGITLSRFSAAENDLILDKLQLIIKWGGEPTHSARYQSSDLGENMRNDLLLMNKDVLDDVQVFTSSERRVSTSAQIWAASFTNQKEVPQDTIQVRKDLLDDSNAAKDVMDKVKKKLKLLLREGHKAPPQFAWPTDMPEPSIVVRKVVELMLFHRKVMRHNFKKLNSGAAASLTALNKPADGSASANGGALAQAQNVANVQAKWCCGEDPEIFKERWEKLFAEFCDSEKVDPSKISELYDSMKFDALHNRQFLEHIFTPSASILAEDAAGDSKSTEEAFDDQKSVPSPRESKDGNGIGKPVEKPVDKPQGSNIAHRMGFRRKSVITHPAHPNAVKETRESYFKLFSGSGQTKAKLDVRLVKLRELYKLAKVLFDFVCPQEYGISNDEKLEIGLLTSLPLLKEIVKDLEEVQASDDAKSFIYFTKESHIYTLLNCILEGGIKTKIERNAIPELDYLSTISFELYESEDKDADTFEYSIRIGITPGCHTFDPLDVQLDSKHSIGCAPRRSLTAHQDWKEVIETLRAKFHTVKLPKSFLAVNVSDAYANSPNNSSVISVTSAESTASVTSTGADD